MPSKRRRQERGAAAVEAALCLPLVMIIVFGVIEMSFLMKDSLAVSSAVRSGGRIASASVMAGGCTSNCGGGTQYTLPQLAVLAAGAVSRDSTAVPRTSLGDVWVYKADAAGFPGTATSMPATCPANCVTLRWNTATNSFAYQSGSWDYRQINACVNTSDSVGVYLAVNHDFITGLFSRSVTLDDKSIFAFEPLPQTVCGAGVRS